MKVHGDLDVLGAFAVKAGVFVHRLSSSNDGGTLSATSWNDRSLNTTVHNTLGGGAHLAFTSQLVNIPAGRYYVDAWATQYNQAAVGMLRLSDVTNGSPGTPLLYGPPVYGLADATTVILPVSGIITFNKLFALELQHYISASSGGDAGGKAASIASISETYVQLTLWRI